MLKKTIKYIDYDEVEREEDFYFNLSQSELTEMELSYSGGLAKMLQQIIATRNSPRLIKMFKELVLKAYGEKSPDGKRFIKSAALRDAFAQTEAYNILFMELANNADAAATFVNAIVPKK